jgi:hypothetical protein
VIFCACEECTARPSLWTHGMDLESGIHPSILYSMIRIAPVVAIAQLIFAHIRQWLQQVCVLSDNSPSKIPLCSPSSVIKGWLKSPMRTIQSESTKIWASLRSRMIMSREWRHLCLATQNTPGGVLSHERCSANDSFARKSHHHCRVVRRRGREAPFETDNQGMVQWWIKM